MGREFQFCKMMFRDVAQPCASTWRFIMAKMVKFVLFGFFFFFLTTIKFFWKLKKNERTKNKKKITNSIPKMKMHYSSFAPPNPYSLSESSRVIHKYSLSLCGQKGEKEKYLSICRSREGNCGSSSFCGSLRTTGQYDVFEIACVYWVTNSKEASEVQRIGYIKSLLLNSQSKVS